MEIKTIESRNSIEDLIRIKHFELASVVKDVHANLRKHLQKADGDVDRVWDEHCRNTTQLLEYAGAMHSLATDIWCKHQESRIDWCHKISVEYFLNDGLQKVLEKEKRRQEYHKLATQEVHLRMKEKVTDFNSIKLPLEGKIRLLDVGSCYNAFMAFDEYLTVGIDLCPAIPSVFECDFLKLDMDDVASNAFDNYISCLESPIKLLPKESFHVVVFSLLLEYFPCPHQRWICCQKAHKLLMMNGLLIIITPDSHRQHRNAPMMKDWKTVIESLGFTRWRYVKLEHMHCLVFRKSSFESIENKDVPSLLHIPQDRRNLDDNRSEQSWEEEEDAMFYLNSFNELPSLLE